MSPLLVPRIRVDMDAERGDRRSARASLLRLRPGRVVTEGEREQAWAVARRVRERPGPRTDDVLVLAGPAEPFERTAFWTLVGHEELVAVAVRLHAGPEEPVAVGSRPRLLEAADRKVVQELRSVLGDRKSTR